MSVSGCARASRHGQSMNGYWRSSSARGCGRRARRARWRPGPPADGPPVAGRERGDDATGGRCANGWVNGRPARGGRGRAGERCGGASRSCAWRFHEGMTTLRAAPSL
jgi:hypothetical protein